MLVSWPSLTMFGVTKTYCGRAEALTSAANLNTNEADGLVDTPVRLARHHPLVEVPQVRLARGDVRDRIVCVKGALFSLNSVL